MKRYLIICKDDAVRRKVKKKLINKMKIKTLEDYNSNDIVGIIARNISKEKLEKLIKMHKNQIRVRKI